MRLERPAVRAEADILAVESCGKDVLLVGTDQGEVAIAGSPDAPSARTKNDARVLSILTIDSQSVLVFTERSGGSKCSATAYTVPALEPIAGLTLHDVRGGVYLGKQVAVFSSGAIRILRFASEASQKVSLERSIELKGVVKGARSEKSSSILLVATGTEYQLVNIKTSARIPLFPIHSDLEPLMAGFGPDFLVVQGTGESEPAMCLVVDTLGEVARSGVVLQWDTYPKSFAATDDYVFAIVGDDNALIIYHVDPVTSLVREISIGISEARSVFRLSFPILVHDNDLFNRLGDERVSQIRAEIAIVLNDGQIELWGQPSSLVVNENKIKAGELSEVVPDPRTAGSEHGVAELEYLSHFLVLYSLENDDYDRALKAWLAGPRNPIELILYVYGDEATAQPELFPGLQGLIFTLRKKGEQGQLSSSFFKSFLRAEIKRHRRNPSTAYTTAKSLELRYAKLLDDQELTRFLLERELKARKEVVTWLEDRRAYAALEHYYTFGDRQADLAKLRYRILRDSQSTHEDAQRAAQETVEYVLASPDQKALDGLDIWDLAMELVSNEKIESKLSLDLLTHPRFESTFEPAEILGILKERTESGEAWRLYLKHLVYSRGLFTDDLASILIADIIDLVSASDMAKSAIENSYAAFRELAWPKPPYHGFLKRWAANKAHGYPQDLMSLETELWHLFESQADAMDAKAVHLDFPSIMSTFEDRLPFFLYERASVFRSLGLHEQALEVLCTSMTDYREVIDYGKRAATNDPTTLIDLAFLTLKQLLASEFKHKNAVLRDFITDNSQWLDLDAVFEQLNDATPFSVVAAFAIGNVKKREAVEKKARLVHALTKADLQRYRVREQPH